MAAAPRLGGTPPPSEARALDSQKIRPALPQTSDLEQSATLTLYSHVRAPHTRTPGQGSWRKNRLVRLATAPLRTTARGIMFPAKVAAERAAREAAAREAARRAGRSFVVRFAERAVKSPYRVLTGEVGLVPESVSSLYRRGVSMVFGVPVSV